MKRLIPLALLIAPGGCESLKPEASAVPAMRQTLDTSDRALAIQRGAAYAQANCSGCHSVGSSGESPLTGAPHFRDLGLRYPVTDLAEAFAEGIVTAHPAMPQFEMSTDENADLIAYLQSIQTGAGG